MGLSPLANLRNTNPLGGGLFDDGNLGFVDGKYVSSILVMGLEDESDGISSSDDEEDEEEEGTSNTGTSVGGNEKEEEEGASPCALCGCY